MLQRALLLILVVAVLTGVLFYSQTRQEPLRVSGYIEADEIRLGSRVGGRVQEVLVDEGTAVQSGQVLVRLEEFDLDERQAQAAAELQAKESEWQRLQAGYRDEEIGQAAARVERLKQKLQALIEGPRPEELEAAKARLRSAQAQLDLTDANYKRNLAIYDRGKGAVSREALDRSVEELKAAQANKEVREQELLLLEKGTREEDIAAARAELAEAEQAWLLTKNGFRKEDIAGAAAAVAAAKAAAEVLQAQQEELAIKAPLDGVVEAMDLEPGDLVAAGAPVVTMLDRREIWVRTYVPENRLGLRLGQRLRVTVDSFPGEDFQGEVTFISQQAEFTPSNVQTPEERSKQVFRIKVALRSGVEKLRPGMAADVWLDD